MNDKRSETGMGEAMAGWIDQGYNVLFLGISVIS